MKKKNLFKRTAAMTLAILIAVISPLSYGGFPLFGMQANAQESLIYLKNIKAEAEGEHDVKVSWDYITDESLLKELAVGTYGVLAEEENGGQKQIVGEITVTEKITVPEPTTEEETTTAEEPTTTTEEPTTTTEEETTTTIQVPATTEETSTVNPAVEQAEEEFIPYALVLDGEEEDKEDDDEDCYPAFYLVPNSTSFNQIKRGTA